MNKLDFRITYEWLYAQYVILRKSVPTMSKDFRISEDTIYRYIKKFSIPVRSKSEYANRKGTHCSEEHKKKLSLIQKKAWSRPGYKEFQSKIHIGQPFTLGMKGRKQSNETKYKLSVAHKGKCFLTEKQKKEHSERMTNDGNPNWKGGISHFPYCEKFDKKFKEHIREKYYHLCVLCHRSEEEIGRKNDVHHIDYNKNSICNGKEWAFVPLCRSCHTKTSMHRFKYFNMLINYWAFNNNYITNNEIFNFSGDYIVYSRN